MRQLVHELLTNPPDDLSDVADMLGMPSRQLSRILSTIKRQYRKSVSKDAKKRTFYDPHTQLRIAQEGIKKWLNGYQLTDHVDGWRKGRSTKTSAAYHVRKHVLVKIDIEDFFPSIYYLRIKTLFKRLGCQDEAADVLTKLTTADRHLPQGFLTSPVIANLILAPFDEKLAKLCRRQKSVQRRTGDDISISMNHPPHRLPSDVCDLVRRFRFRVNEKKFLEQGIRYKHEHQEVCGIVVNNGLSIPQEKFEFIRGQLTKRIHGDCEPTNDVNQQDSLRGSIAYAKYINQRQGFKLYRLFKRAFPSQP